MKYNVIIRTRSANLINNVIFKQIPRTYASAGLGLWDKIIDTDIKHKIEEYWKEKVNLVNQNQDGKEKDKFYVLSMFPYPSGSLHMGHVRVYAISDSVARFHRLNGKRVIHPMGWDAFGLPAENAAIERQIDPAEWTNQNIKVMREQLKKLGCLFDWDREFATCDPDYYKWTQELFIKLFERELVYQNESYVNWDPVDQTVLADEQVDENNRSWRSGAKVEKKLLRQWFIKTTAFSKQLLDGLNDPILKEWRDVIKIQQNWIGKCNGTNIKFELISEIKGYPKSLTLWTDKPEYIKDAKFLAISNSNLLCKQEGIEAIDDYQILNAKIINPFTNEELPIYVTNLIQFPSLNRDDHLGIPVASEEDAEFCKIVGIQYESDINQLNNEERELRREQILNEAKKLKIGGYPVSQHIKDWLISRQRYWGTPIPIIHCDSCGPRPVHRNELPVILPKLNRSLKNKKASLFEATDWLKTSCPNCGKDAVREADTMDTFVDSSWYFMRFIDSKNQKEMFSQEKARENLPVDLYIGGKEHAALHLYYARFINHFLYSEGLVPTREPFKQLLVQGMVKGLSFQEKSSGKYLKEDQVQKIGKDYVEKETNLPVKSKWEKMSKSKYNGVDPSEMISNYSIDTIRLLILGDVAPTSHRNWSTDTFPGILNWQKRLWLLVKDFIKLRSTLTEKELKTKPEGKQFEDDDYYMFDSRNYYIKGVTFNITGSQQLSVAISKMQGLTNSLRKISKLCLIRSPQFERALAVQIIMLAPLAPHFASELWSGFCSAPHRMSCDETIQWDKDVLEQCWPQIDMNYNMLLRVFMNNADITFVKVTRKDLESLSTDQALELIMKDSKVINQLKKLTITDVNLHVESGYDGRIYLTTEKLNEELAQKDYSR
ncbi:leucine--tRNA ligase, mitochondrial isoform X2 [Leptopilina boulardi]|uniref:leucine--tRNA ligase, mitochondrial isoform X2 n=1 Tax=Leptopilina boulardi TaxID=63433 RepID=UPI0021F57343|nr:leucine--tRNA ligase, mitochondrial isoform X2 [Leptopilina boulardi]